jgi:hypothetical protein
MADKDGNVIGLWQGQSSEGFRMTPQEIQMKLQAHDRAMREQKRSGYLAGAFLLIAFSTWAILDNHLLLRLGIGAVVVAFAFIAVQVRRSRSRAGLASTMSTPSIVHLRRELQWQADNHRGKTFWSRWLVLVPAGVFFFFAFARTHPQLVTIIRIELATFIAIMMAAIPLNLRMARKYQGQIDELDRQKETA